MTSVIILPQVHSLEELVTLFGAIVVGIVGIVVVDTIRHKILDCQQARRDKLLALGSWRDNLPYQTTRDDSPPAKDVEMTMEEYNKSWGRDTK